MSTEHCKPEMSTEKCKNCGAASVVQDEDNIVCTSCGHIQRDGTSFQQERNLEGSGQVCNLDSAYPKTFGGRDHRLKERRVSKALVDWKKYLNQLCDRMQIRNKEMQKAASQLFERAYNVDQFRKLHRDGKIALCASCVYVTCRQQDWPILIGDVMSAIDMTDDSLVKRTNQVLINTFKLEITSPSMEEYIPNFLAGYGMTDKALVEKTISVIGVVEHLSLQEGRHRASLIVAACCIAWQASNRQNNKMRLETFCKTVLKKNVEKTLHKRYQELIKVLKAMFDKLPWVSTLPQSRRTWLLVLDDILKYKQILTSRLDAPQSDDLDVLDPIVQENVFLPPSFRNAKRKRSPEDDSEERTSKSCHLTREQLASTELSEKDIPDSELGQYIRTPEEVEIAKELMLFSHP